MSLNFSFGTFGFGYYTLGFELAVEESYPIDQTFGTAMLFFCGQIQGGLLITIASALNTPLSANSQKYQVFNINSDAMVRGRVRFIKMLEVSINGPYHTLINAQCCGS